MLKLKEVNDNLESTLFEMFDAIHNMNKNKIKYVLFIDPVRRMVFWGRFKLGWFNPRIKWPIWRLLGNIQEWVGKW